VRRKLRAGLQKVEQNLQVIAGTPTTVIPKIKTILSVLRPGVFIMFSIQSPVGNLRLSPQNWVSTRKPSRTISLPCTRRAASNPSAMGGGVSFPILLSKGTGVGKQFAFRCWWACGFKEKGSLIE
jgi:hypothetical protein